MCRGCQARKKAAQAAFSFIRFCWSVVFLQKYEIFLPQSAGLKGKKPEISQVLPEIAVSKGRCSDFLWCWRFFFCQTGLSDTFLPMSENGFPGYRDFLLFSIKLLKCIEIKCEEKVVFVGQTPINLPEKSRPGKPYLSYFLLFSSHCIIGVFRNGNALRVAEPGNFDIWRRR